MALTYKKEILLTGAGFTANFGGLLAREMWSKILNNKKMEGLPTIKELLRKDFDFESVYADVKRNPAISGEEKLLFQEIILDSYTSMDQGLRSYTASGRDPYGIYFGNASTFIASFQGSGQEMGFHFTLNQDLFLERQVQRVPLGFLVPEYRDYFQSITSQQLDPKIAVQLPNEAALENFKTNHLPSVGNFAYVKLHGSHGWQSSKGGDQMVLGNNKLQDIQNEPLLKWYLELFEQALSCGNARLFILGYGFRDEHINALILKAVQEQGLRIYIISPEDPESLKDRLEGKNIKNPHASYSVHPNQQIWNAVDGYFPYRLRDLFPADQSVPPAAADLRNAVQP